VVLREKIFIILIERCENRFGLGGDDLLRVFCIEGRHPREFFQRVGLLLRFFLEVAVLQQFTGNIAGHFAPVRFTLILNINGFQLFFSLNENYLYFGVQEAKLFEEAAPVLIVFIVFAMQVLFLVEVSAVLAF
jgi:hypothetical protein